MYAVKEIFYTLQGEGANAGTPAVFCRFAGCNLWSGREAGPRQRGLPLLRHRIRRHRRRAAAGASRRPPNWSVRCNRCCRPASPAPLVVCTGGEPLLQLDTPLRGCDAPRGIPRRGRNQRHAAARRRHRLDLRQPEGRRAAGAGARQRTEAGLPAGRRRAAAPSSASPSTISSCSRWMVPTRAQNTRRAVDYCLAHPRWRLSLQSHKLIGIP